MIENGIDLIGQYDSYLKEKRLGVLTSVSGLNRQFISTIDVLSERYNVTALFAPEHGVRGDKGAGEQVDTYIDSVTGLTVYSLYRKDSKRFTKEMLEQVDAVVYDIQDLGTRYYTFISTMIYSLEDCEKYGKELIVLDRPNPLGGEKVEGSVLSEGFKSFVGASELATRYGLTIGELAKMINEEENIHCKLTVIPCKGWSRTMLHSDTDCTWIMPSLGVPKFETALLYPGTCLVEGTNLSEGRGTSCPFELIGAPFIQADNLVKLLRDKNLPGVAFTPAYFTPTTSKHEGVFCQGVHIHITEVHQYESYRTGLCLLEAVRDLYPENFRFLPPVKEGGKPFISLLNGNDMFEHEDWTADKIMKANQEKLEAFQKRKQAYHQY